MSSCLICRGAAKRNPRRRRCRLPTNRAEGHRVNCPYSKECGMTSQRKIKSNRANAQASTGPKTAQGKARAAQSARRHGLSLPIVSDPILSDQVESLAKEIVGEITDREIYEHARRIAEAQIDL